MSTMKAVEIGKPGGSFALVEREVPEPGAGQVRIKISACGMCHSEALVKEGHWPGIRYPRVPGHEVAGVVDAVGSGVSAWKKGQRVGVGWEGGHCGSCIPCRRGDFINCASLQITGLSFDGGYADFLVVSAGSLARIPDALSFEEAAPILCAGVTTYNALRNSGARPGDVVAIQGIGGLGHLGVQFANKMGFKTVAISKGKDKEILAKKLGAHLYLDTEKTDTAAELMKLGGAKAILATAPSGRSISPLVNGLGHQGALVIAGASVDPIEVTAIQLIVQTRRIQGWASGSAIDSEEALNFCALTGIRPMIETFALEAAGEAYERMLANRVRFRAVLTV